MSTKASNGSGSGPDAPDDRPEVAGGEVADAGATSDDDAGIAIEVEAPDPSDEPDDAGALTDAATSTEDADAPTDDAAATDETPPVVAELEAKNAELEARAAELETKRKDTYDRLLRTTADLDNFRKRTKREMELARVDARSKVLIEILPVVDNLERALAHAGGAEDHSGIADGVSLVLRQFVQVLERLGVTPIEAVGQPFDPNVHEAVSQAPSDEYPAGTVMAEMQKGYLIGERLLRPTLAVVSSAPPAPVEAPDDAADGDDGGGDSDDGGANGHDKDAGGVEE